MRLETIEHAKTRAHAQLIVDKEKGIEAFEEYMKIAFPYLTATRKQERKAGVEVLKNWVGQGPLTVKPLVAPRLRSRISEAKRAKPPTPEEERRLYRKIGRSI